MYGGHITDQWDRRTNMAYLGELFRPELLTVSSVPAVRGAGAGGGGGGKKTGSESSEAAAAAASPGAVVLELAPGFKSPKGCEMDYSSYTEYIDRLPAEAPQLFGLHPNTEIGFLTQVS